MAYGTGGEVWPDGAPTAARARGCGLSSYAYLHKFSSTDAAYRPTDVLRNGQYCVPLLILTSAYPLVPPVRARAYWSTARGTDAGA
eukprot:2616726-Rhodomonas_salina.4